MNGQGTRHIKSLKKFFFLNSQVINLKIETYNSKYNNTPLREIISNFYYSTFNTGPGFFIYLLVCRVIA